MPAPARPPLTLPEYERVFRTIHGVLQNDDSEPSKECLFFAIAGAFMLSKHHGLNAFPRCGAAAYNLNTVTNAVLVLGALDTGTLVSNDESFHCWIEVDGWIVDFTAPLFNDMIDPIRAGQKIPPKMFQKTPRARPSSLNDLNAPGAYCHAVDGKLHNELMSSFRDLPANGDLVQICAEWYRPPPKKVADSIQVFDQHGNPSWASHSPVRIGGSW